MNYEKEYQEEVKILNDIYSRYDKLNEECILYLTCVPNFH